MAPPRPRGQVLWRSLPARTRGRRLIFIVSGRRTLRHVRLLRKPTTKKRRTRTKSRRNRCESVSSRLIFILSGRRSLRHERALVILCLDFWTHVACRNTPLERTRPFGKLGPLPYC